MIRDPRGKVSPSLKTPQAQTHLRRTDMIGAGTPGRFAEFHKRETERWGAVVKSAGVKPE